MIRRICLFGLSAFMATTTFADTIVGNCNAIGNNNTITCTFDGRADFSDDLGKALIAKMPDKSKPVSLATVGSQKDQAVGSKVEKFLQDNGYVVRRSTIGMLSPPPDNPFTLQIGGEQYSLIVAPSAH